MLWKPNRRPRCLLRTHEVPVRSVSFDEYADNVREADLEYLMTGPSRGPWKVGYCQVNSIVLQYGVEGGSKILHGKSRSDALIFIVPHTKFADRVIFDGQEIRPYTFAVLPPSSHFTAATFGFNHWISISVPNGLFGEVAEQIGRSDLNWIEREKCLISTSRKLVDCLATEATNIVAAFANSAPLTQNRQRQGVEHALLHSLLAAISGRHDKTSLSEDNTKSSNKIMSRALEYVHCHKWQALRVNDIAHAAEVTERTLHRSFEQQLGIGPSRYLKLRQLNIVRRALRGKLGISLPITAIMAEHGVTEFGRFAGEYRTLFGESPSETRQRYGHDRAVTVSKMRMGTGNA